METICAEQQPNHYIIGAVDFPLWEQGEPWEAYHDSRNPESSNPFDDTSPGLSFDGSMNWIDGHEHLCHACSSVSLIAVSPAIQAPEVINSIPTKTTKAEAQDTPILNSSPKRKPTQPQSITKLTNAIDSKPKRPCHSRSTSFSLATLDRLVTNKEQKDREKEDVYFERSRSASSKFRERKRNKIAQLASQEYTREDANRQLRGILDALTSEILFLKMQLLQHTDCNYELIQAYISKEAGHFVKNLQGAKE